MRLNGLGLQFILSFGFNYGFLAAGIGMVLGQIMFNLLAQKYLGDLGKEPGANDTVVPSLTVAKVLY